MFSFPFPERQREIDRQRKRESISAILCAVLWSFVSMVITHFLQNIRQSRGSPITAVSAVLPVQNAIGIAGNNGAGINGVQSLVRSRAGDLKASAVTGPK